MTRYRRNSVTIDVCEVVDAIDDEFLIEEVRRRKLVIGGETDALPEDLIEEAYLELVRGRTAEARTILERLLYPKWRSPAAAQAAFEALKKSA